jgi:hypothetical protein
MVEEYRRGARKFYKPALKGETDKKELKAWIEYSKLKPCYDGRSLGQRYPKEP